MGGMYSSMGKHLPIDTNWNDNTTASDILKDKDYSGKNVVVTGCTSGIGKEFARAFFEKNANIFMVNRNEEKSIKVSQEWKEKYPSSKGETKFFKCDISELESVQQVAKELVNEFGDKKIDILLLNALQFGFKKLLYDKNGRELMFVGSVYSSHILVCKLLPFMNENGRIVNTTSAVAKMAESSFPEGPNFDDLYFKKKHESGKLKMMEGMDVYGMSKFCSASLFYWYDQRIQKIEGKKKIGFFSAGPGPTITPAIEKDMGFLLLKLTSFLGFFNSGLKFRKVEAGTSTLVVAASDDRVMDEKYRGKFLQWCGIGNYHKKQFDLEIGKKILEKSENETGVKFPY